jgi:hypothetical protein
MLERDFIKPGGIMTGKKVLETAHHPTEHDKAEIQRRYRSGEYPLMIALDLDISFEDLKSVIKNSFNTLRSSPNKRLVKSKRQFISRPLIDKMVKLYDNGDGNNYVEIASIMGLKPQTVCTNIRRELLKGDDKGC